MAGCWWRRKARRASAAKTPPRPGARLRSSTITREALPTACTSAAPERPERVQLHQANAVARGPAALHHVAHGAADGAGAHDHALGILRGSRGGERITPPETVGELRGCCLEDGGGARYVVVQPLVEAEVAGRGHQPAIVGMGIRHRRAVPNPLADERQRLPSLRDQHLFGLVRQVEPIAGDHRREGDLLGHAEGDQQQVEHFLGRLAVELQPPGIAHEEGIVLMGAQAPAGAFQRPVEHAHHQGQPVPGHLPHHLGHEDQALGGGGDGTALARPRHSLGAGQNVVLAVGLHGGDAGVAAEGSITSTWG